MRMSDWNQKVIEEFRANDGKVAQFGDVPILLLHTTGARTGEERVTPLAARIDGEDLIVYGSYAGATRHPAWFHNLVAHPRVTVEIGTETREVVARVAEGAEHDRLWARQKEEIPTFAEYEQKAEGRTIPVIVLQPAKP